jgi:hypothetical protein
VTLVVLVVAIVIVDLVLRMILRRQRPARKHAPRAIAFRGMRIAVNVLAAAALFLAAYTALHHEGRLTGDSLIWHVTMAPAFAVMAVAITLFWAHRNEFSGNDWRHSWALPLRKLFFWISVALAIPTMLSILAAMYPLTDTSGQQDLIRFHRNCGPLLAAAGFLFGYFALMTWWEGSRD